MAIEKFNKNMAIIAALDDEPNDVGGLTAAELKAKFDEGGQALKDYLNATLLPALERLGVGAILQTASAQMKYLRVTAEGVVQYSADGETWTAVHSGASGTGGGAAVGSVLYNAAQNLTDAQKEQARANIGAVSAAELKEATGDISSALDTINGEVV